MNSNPHSTYRSSKRFYCLVSALALALTVPARAETPPSAIPFSDLGARATATYQGDALGITATANGARLRCGFQKLEGHATPEGLWRESTKPGGGQLRLMAVAVGRDGKPERPHPLTEAASSVRSGMSIVTVPQGDQAPLGATCTHGAASLFDMPLLTELETAFSGVPFYRHAAPDGAIACLKQGDQTLARTGEVSVNEKLVRLTRPGLTEEYSVSVDGVRQDFIIESPPLNPPPSTLNHSAGDLRVELALSGARAEATASGARLTLEGSGRALAYSRLRVEDATGRELTARLEVLSPDRLVVSVADANATYPVRIDPTFSDADWVSLNPGLAGANGGVCAIAVDGSGNVYVGGTFTFIGTAQANYIAKWDGSTWSALGSGVGGIVFALAVSGTTLYAGGYLGGVAKWDGSAWSTLGSGMNNQIDALAVVGTNLYAGGFFTYAGGVTANCIAKWNGSAWSALGSGLAVGGYTSPRVYALAVSGTHLYAGGEFTTAGGVPANNVAKWDGSAWSALGSGVNNDVFALTASGTDLYAGGWFTNAGGVPASYIAKWNGSTWSALASGMSDTVGALVVSGTNLYAGGYFATAGRVPANDIAKWDGSGWSALSSGKVGNDGSISALAMSGSVLYAGGQFTWAGGVSANHIVKWDGSAWSALGSGVNGTVNALTVSGTNLYAGGSFTTAGGVPANSVAKWNGSSWSALGSGLASYSSPSSCVYALAVSGPDLYAGGWFDAAGGVPANNVAKWDGSAWSALGSGMSNPPGSGSQYDVLALAVSGTNLYAGGYFTMAGAVAATNIAKWDGEAWSALGSGINGTVYALAVSGTDLIAAGYFNMAGGVPANHIALCHGSVWSALGSGVDGTVYALAMSGTDLYAAGHIPIAGGMLANNIAKWNWSAWSALGSGMTGGGDYSLGDYSYGLHPVNALAADGVGHLFVGGNFLLAGTNLSPYIAQADLGGVPTNRPPYIIDSPASLAVASGATAQFQVEVIGSPPLIYRWVFNGTNAIADATGAVLTLTNVQLTQAGAYSVMVSNLYGTVTSAPALLQVFPRGIVVTNSGIALREAMTGGGTVTFACDGTITLASTITNVNDTVLDGSGRQVTISGNNGVRVFSVATNVHFSVVNLTIADGTSSGGSAILNLGGIVNLTGVTFRSNSVAIFNRGGIMNATNCSFTGNSAQISSGYPPLACGGGIRNEAGQVNLRACAFVGNQASGWGSEFGVSAGQGGAIHNTATATLDLCTLAGNSAAGGSAALTIGYPGISGGEGSGGAIYNQGTLTADRTTLSGNTATGGYGGQAGTSRSYHPDGFAGGAGGGANGAAICNLGSLCITRSTFVSNVVAGGGGGGGGALDPFAGPLNGGAGGDGGSGLGGAVFSAGQASLVNCTIAFNTGQGGAGGSGGPGFSSGGPGLSSGGAGGNGGAGFGGVDGTCNLTNCTVAFNRGIPGPGGGGGQGFNVPPGRGGTIGAAWGGTACSALVNTLIVSNTPAGGDSLTDPKLGPLADNGGPTLTMALLPGSPAIDAGNTSLAPTTDQRGFPRPAGLAADIGAFEYGSVMPTIAVSRSGATGLNILGSGNAGQSCRLLWSTDLSSWVPMATNQFGANGTVLFYDNYAPGSACRFYRLVMP
jgi:hypothetical protein